MFDIQMFVLYVWHFVDGTLVLNNDHFLYQICYWWLYTH